MANKAQTGQIGVTTENIFPVIKQFLYSDHEIFLRELVANAVDATQKMKTLASNGEFKGELGDLKVSVELDEKKKTLKIVDNGIGMTAEEVDKYINQIAFSSAGEFLEKYKDQNIIGHFGLGFYSAFMVSKKVTIESLSWKEGSQGVMWSCEGDPQFEMKPCKKDERGTIVTLYLDDESANDYGNKGKISQLLGKYCKFMPVPIVFGKEQEWKDKKYVDTDKDHVINAIEPLWTRKPSELKDEDYVKFYKDLYPMKEEPLFHIHLNVDYPFNLTGILYFPKIKERMAIEKNNIQLYCNQMFVTDHVENIVPDFLTLLHGVIDSPDIPLNVSRSYLQADENVKKISTYITKKVADRLEEIFKNDRAAWESKWDNLKLFIEYGMLSDEKFCERALKFTLLKNTDGKFFALEDYRKAIADTQTDKDKKVVYLYATDVDAQYPFIEAAKNKGYDVLLMDCELDSHFVNLLEQKIGDTRFARVDSDSVDNLIPTQEKVKPEMAEEDKKNLETMFKAILPKDNEYFVEADNLGEDAAPILITRNEFMRRYREMSALGGGMNFYGEMPESYNITANLQNPLMVKLVGELKDNSDKVEDFASNSDLLKQITDLALLSNGLLKGKALADFITRTGKTLTDYYSNK
ncbi:MAG: molecular chaperone HtpG [Bacteroidales bacterium]|nr:molecular chaperone HtpG [Bacteroidales bacterium]